jgi:hypothetical protein
MDADWRGADHRFAAAGTSRRAGWDWTPPMSAAAHSCLLVVTSCDEDSPGLKSLIIDQVVTQNRQVGLKNLHIIDALRSLPGTRSGSTRARRPTYSASVRCRRAGR